MIILEDTRNKPGKHDLKNIWFEENGIEVRRTKLYAGDYTPLQIRASALTQRRIFRNL